MHMVEKTQNAVNKPGSKGRFRPGVSGNPMGRPKGSIDARFRCRQLDDKTLAVLEALLDDEDGDLRFKAACRIRDEAWGKPVQSVQVMQEDHMMLERMTDSELMAIATGAAVEMSTRAPEVNS